MHLSQPGCHGCGECWVDSRFARQESKSTRCGLSCLSAKVGGLLRLFLSTVNDKQHDS